MLLRVAQRVRLARAVREAQFIFEFLVRIDRRLVADGEGLRATACFASILLQTLMNAYRPSASASTSSAVRSRFLRWEKIPSPQAAGGAAARPRGCNHSARAARAPRRRPPPRSGFLRRSRGSVWNGQSRRQLSDGHVDGVEATWRRVGAKFKIILL